MGDRDLWKWMAGGAVTGVVLGSVWVWIGANRDAREPLEVPRDFNEQSVRVAADLASRNIFSPQFWGRAGDADQVKQEVNRSSLPPGTALPEVIPIDTP